MDNREPTIIAGPASSIRVQHRDDRSILDATTQALLKPFASLILKPPHTTYTGSPRLTPPKAAEKICHVEEKLVEEMRIYVLSPLGDRGEEKRPDVPHKLYYFAGGGFRGPANKGHWALCAELCLKLPQYEINLVSYPLVPESPASTTIPHLENVYRALAQRSREQKFRMTFMGDSAGGNIALVLGIYAAAEYLRESAENTQGSVCPVENVLAICPATDLRNENPGIDAIDQKDSLLSRKAIVEVAVGWIGEWSLSDPRVSPILADLELFKRANIKVDGVIAGYDVLAPDALLFRKKLGECGVKGDWLEWEKQMHCFPLMFPYHVREGVEGKDWIVDILNSNIQWRG
jgi:acetyl esterase/lipase